MFKVLELLGANKLPLEGLRTYIMIFIGVIAAVYEPIMIMLAEGGDLTDLNFMFKIGAIVVPAVMAAFYKKAGVEREKEKAVVEAVAKADNL